MEDIEGMVESTESGQPAAEQIPEPPEPRCFQCGSTDLLPILPIEWGLQYRCRRCAVNITREHAISCGMSGEVLADEEMQGLRRFLERVLDGRAQSSDNDLLVYTRTLIQIPDTADSGTEALRFDFHKWVYKDRGTWCWGVEVAGIPCLSVKEWPLVVKESDDAHS